MISKIKYKGNMTESMNAIYDEARKYVSQELDKYLKQGIIGPVILQRNIEKIYKEELVKYVKELVARGDLTNDQIKELKEKYHDEFIDL